VDADVLTIDSFNAVLPCVRHLTPCQLHNSQAYVRSLPASVSRTAVCSGKNYWFLG